MKFVVGQGKDKQEFYVQAGSFGRLSCVLQALVYAPMREAAERLVEWPDVDGDTFKRLVSFAYYGKYTEAAPVKQVKLNVFDADLQG